MIIPRCWYFLRFGEGLDCKEIQPVHPKGNQSWIVIERTDAEAETPILWPLDVKNWLIWKDPDAGKDWRQEEKGMTENEMVGWHRQLNRHEFEQSLGVGDGQGSLACCSPWGRKELDTTEQMNWTDWMPYTYLAAPTSLSPVVTTSSLYLWVSVSLVSALVS